MIRWWRQFHRLGFPLRWLVKSFVVLVVVLLVLYPHLGLLARHIHNIRHAAQLPDPNEPAFAVVKQAYEHDLAEKQIPAGPEGGTALLAETYRFVCKQVPYGWDWDVWGVVDYLPTLREVLERGREDCDGRAVMAAALLRSVNVPADLVADGKHVWVSTPLGETMGPTGPPAVISSTTGLRVHWTNFVDMGLLAVGVAVFPLVRELIILVTVWLAWLGPGLTGRRGGLALLFLLDGLAIVRVAGTNVYAPCVWGAWLGLVHAGLGLYLLARPNVRRLEAGRLG